MRRAVLLCCYGLSLSAHSFDFSTATIHGVSKTMQQNIVHRLNDFYQQTPMNQLTVDNLRLQTAQALYPYGYFKSSITVIINANRNKVQINILPGVVLRITSLSIHLTGPGKNNDELQQAVCHFPLETGQVFNSITYEKAKNQLLDAAGKQGYLHAAFDTAIVRIDQEHDSAEITLLLNTGPQYYFGSVDFGKNRLSSCLLSRYIPFACGQPYSTDKIVELNNVLSNSGYFKSVNVNPEPAIDNHVPVKVDFQPVDRFSYSIGAGYGTDTGPRGRLGLNVIPVNAYGHQFKAIAQGSFTDNTVQGQYLVPGKNPVREQYALQGGFSNLNYQAGHANSLLVGVARQYTLSTFQSNLSLNALNEQYSYTNNTLVPEQAFLIFPKGVLTWRKVSDPLFSPSGYNLALTGLGSAKSAFSQVSLAQISINAKAALMVDIIRTRFFVHALQGFTGIGEINQLPLSLALLLGGPDNMRGFNYNSMGPGKITSYAGIEIQKEMVNKWYLTGFFDCGDVYDPFPKNTQYDAGGGLMWVSPVGPIKAGVAQVINQRWQRVPGGGLKLVINMGPDL